VKRIKLSAAVFAVVMLAVPVGALAYKAIAPGQGALNMVACYSDPAADGCNAARDLNEPVNVGISGDGSRIYVASHSSSAIAAFVRNRGTGLLAQGVGAKGCLSETGDAGACGTGRALNGPTDVAGVGDYFLWTSDSDNALGWAKKDPESKKYEMTSASRACVSEDGNPGCRDGHGLTTPMSLEIGPQGNQVYVGADSSIAVIQRDRLAGSVSQSSGDDGCINDDGSDGCTDGYVPGPVKDILISSDGKYVYAAAAGNGILDDGAVLVFERNTGTGNLDEVGCINNTGLYGCVAGSQMQNPTGLSAESSNAMATVYVAAHGSNAVDVLARNKDTGGLSQIQCWNELGIGGCNDGYDLTGANRVELYKTNKFVYVTAGDNVASFARDKHSGLLTQLPSPAACTSETGDAGNCIDGSGLSGASGMISTGGGKHVYVTGTTSDAVVALRIK